MTLRKSSLMLAAALALMAVASMTAAAQTYNSNTGGYNTGYGTVYGTFGLAQATQNIYNTMQMNMQRAMLQATLKKGGGSGPARGMPVEARPPGKAPAGPPRVVRNFGKFRPDRTVDTAKLLGDVLGATSEEKILLGQIYTGVKAAYDKEAAAKGWQNNFAGAFTFFIVSNATVYHDSAEPSDETAVALYEAMNATIDEIPEFGKMSDRDKQGFNNLLIGFAAIPLATYSEGKKNGDAATVKVARELAGQLIQMVLNTNPDNIRFQDGTMQFSRKAQIYQGKNYAKKNEITRADDPIHTLHLRRRRFSTNDELEASGEPYRRIQLL